MKNRGAAAIRGLILEYKFCALVYLRSKNKGYNFKLTSNMKRLGALDDEVASNMDLGAFDDDVIEYLDDNCSKKHIFLQLKSKVNKKITMQQLLAEKKKTSVYVNMMNRT